MIYMIELDNGRFKLEISDFSKEVDFNGIHMDTNSEVYFVQFNPPIQTKKIAHIPVLGQPGSYTIEKSDRYTDGQEALPTMRSTIYGGYCVYKDTLYGAKNVDKPAHFFYSSLSKNYACTCSACKKSESLLQKIFFGPNVKKEAEEYFEEIKQKYIGKYRYDNEKGCWYLDISERDQSNV